MPFLIAPKPTDFLRHAADVAPDLRQRAVVIRFANPVRMQDLEVFLTIHLTREMKAAGEEAAYKPEVFQPQRVRDRVCPLCYQAMTKVRPTAHRCTNPRCRTAEGRPTSEMAFMTGPLTGIVDVKVPPEWKVTEVTEQVPCGLTWDKNAGRMVQNVRSRSMPLVSGCVVILDRRYDDLTLAAVYRTCGLICDRQGWKLA